MSLRKKSIMLLRLMGSTYDFENGQKKNGPWMSDFLFSFFMFGEVSMESELFCG
jgi:hypothetical protein